MPPPGPSAQPADAAAPTRFSVRGDLPVRRVGGQVHVMTPDGRIHTLDNPSAVAAWEALERAGMRGLDAPGLAEALVARFRVDPPAALRDAAAFLGALARVGLAAEEDRP